MTPPISICIATDNKAQTLGAALESARRCPWCAELLVLDSGSTDGSHAIAQALADRVEDHIWTSYSQSKKRMVDMAQHRWVFILDADEEITEELAAEIAQLTEADFQRHPIFSMPRRNYVLGRHVKAWDPDRQDRLIDRCRVVWPDKAVHDERLPTEGSVRALKGVLLHNAHVNEFSDYFDGERYARRTLAIAQEMYRKGRRATWLTLLTRPILDFMKYYLLKGGIWQGSFGILIAYKAAVSTQLKYACLWNLQQSNAVDPARKSDDGATAV